MHHRDYDPVRDAEDLERICKNVYNGRDYLPRVIDLFVDSPVDYPMVLEGLDSRVAALGNVQMLPTGDAWLQAVCGPLNHARECENRTIISSSVAFALRGRPGRPGEQVLTRLSLLWPQIRVDEEAKGRGMGTEITKVLTFKSFSLGSQRVLSSTTPTNPVMRHIFDKLGFAKYDHSWVWMARPALSARGGGDEPRGLNGADFLEKSGLLAGCEGASVDGFEACGSVERAQAVLKSAGGGKGQYMVGEYRVHSVDQDLGRGAVEEGRCWVKGESTIAMAWKSPELRGGWFLGVVSDSAEDVKGAILLAAKELDAPFSLAFSGDIQAGSVLQGECLEQVGECEYFEKIFDSPRKSVSLEYIYAP